ncbi:MAG TPA: thioredoxin-disulfide reductase [Candidatus Nitrosotalea sp.]|nr:thioredoxin-disulfide reductase [Candidatus Nitrosotalea sp.]
MEDFDVIIVGGGPAGLAAGLYAARMNLKAVLIDRGPLGGQLLNTELIEDYPGVRSILGHELAEKMAEHAREFGLEIRDFMAVEEIDPAPGQAMRRVRTEDGQELQAPALIMAAGGLPRKIDVPGEAELAGRGVSYCAVCDGAFFRDQALAVIGGGDAALEEADFLTRYASRVYVIHRRDSFRAQSVLQDRARANPKIEFIMDAHVQAILGEDKVRAVRYEREGKVSELEVGGVFIFVGFLPNSGVIKGHLEHDSAGYLITDRDMNTSVEGLWAVGDVRAQLTKQIATAVGDGTTAAVAASNYLTRLKDTSHPAGVA